MRKNASRVVGFLALSLVIYVAAIAVAAKVRVGELSLLQYLTGNTFEPGGRYQSLRRFREAETRGKVDLVFFGSSHAYRAFDPRLFAEAGYTSMNLGSMNQTPLNTFALAGRYLPRLGPALVVIELFAPTIAGDGLESTRDLVTNTRFAWSSVRMAAATWNVGALTYAVAKGFGLAADETRAAQREIPGETYVSGGYCETVAHRTALVTSDERVAIEVRREQLDYLARTTALARSLGARVVWVSQPVPADYTRTLQSPGAVEEALRLAAQAQGVDYWTFDASLLTLDPITDYADLHHLSASGVAKFDRAVIAQLRAAGYLADALGR